MAAAGTAAASSAAAGMVATGMVAVDGLGVIEQGAGGCSAAAVSWLHNLCNLWEGGLRCTAPPPPLPHRFMR